jgi:hypothetical protein
LLEEYAETKTYVENRKPYWLYVDASRKTELSYEPFNYFPEAHYGRAIKQAFLNAVTHHE